MLAHTRRQILETASLVAGGLVLGAATGGRRAEAAEAAATSVVLPPKDDLTHLLGRVTYGFQPQEYARAGALGYEAYVDYQLDYEAIDDSALEAQLAAKLPTLDMTFAQLLALEQDKTTRSQALQELIVATLERAAYSQRQLFQVMVEFWSDHFSINADEGPEPALKPFEDREVMRKLALTTFPQLLRADAQSPAMLYFLNNVENKKGVPNENYARELMELHTLSVNGGYTEDDVKNVARIFTGWTYSRADGSFRFDAANHDFDAKTVLGHSFPAGRGVQEGLDLLDLLAAQPSTATFIATKLARRFASDQPPDSLVAKVAATFTSTGGDVKACLRTLLLADEFLASQDAKFKRPFEFVVSLLRSTGVILSDPGVASLLATLRTLNQVPFSWPAPNGFPDVGAYWTSTSSLLARWNQGFAMVQGAQPGRYTLDVKALASQATTPDDIVDRLAARVLNRPLASADRDALVSYAANGGSARAQLSGKALDAAQRGTLGLILASRYFQMR